jgi:hypothetical protein
MASRSSKHDREDLLDWAADHGWSARVCGSGHLQFRRRGVFGAVHAPSTPSNGHEETRRKLERAMRTGVAGPFMAAVVERGRVAA